MYIAADGCQPGQDTGQVGHAGAFPSRGVKGEGDVFTLSQDGRNQAGQSGARTRFQKQPYPGGIHRFNLGHELDRFGQLPGQQFFGGGHVGRIFGRAAVGIDRNLGRIEFDLLNRCQKRHCGIGHQRAVESGRHRQAFAGKFALRKYLCSPFDLSAASRQNRLGRGVAVSDYQIEAFFSDDLLDGRQRRRDRQHASLVAGARSHQ